MALLLVAIGGGCDAPGDLDAPDASRVRGADGGAHDVGPQRDGHDAGTDFGAGSDFDAAGGAYEPNDAETPDAEGPAPEPAETDAAVPTDRDAQTPDAGRSDSGSGGTDASRPSGDGGFFGASRCRTAGVALCEDFESGAIDGATWTRTTRMTTVGVDTAHAARGRFALHVHSGNAAGSQGFIQERRTFPTLGRHFFGRMFVYFERATPDYNFVLASATGPLPGGGTAAYNLGGQTAPWGSATGTPYFRFGYHPGDLIQKSAEQIPIDRWVCMEWEYRGASNELLFWRDERAVPAMSVASTQNPRWTAPSFTELAIGYHTAHPTSDPNIDVWIDEIAVDGARIGCTR